MSAADRTVFANLLAGVAEEMGVTLARTAYSPNIKERRDFSCAVFDARARMVAQAAHIPVHLGAMPLSVEAVLAKLGPLGRGDVAILNDPFSGGTHLPDITLVSPVYAGRGQPAIAYLATRAHHADVGGMTPGSLPLSRDIYQEGLRLPAVKLIERRVEHRAVMEILAANSRTPGERVGDLRAQLAAHACGSERLVEAAQRYGPARLGERMDDLIAYGRTLMRIVIARIPDGRYTFEDALDDDGLTDQPIVIRLTMTIRGSSAALDFTRSDPQCAGSVNAVEAITRSAAYYCFLCLLATPSPLHEGGIDAQPLLNAGCFEPIVVRTKPGTVVRARAPAAVAGGNVETSQRIVDVVFGALDKALQGIPGVVPAQSQGTMNNLTLGGIDPRSGGAFAYYETIAGGMGARSSEPGMDGVQTHMTNTMNTPIEALEFAYPLRVERYEIARRTGGTGAMRGGCGVRRDVRVLVDARGAILSDRRKKGPEGARGGGSGKAGVNALTHRGRRKRLPGKVELTLEAGDVVHLQTPGGGGYGKRS